MMENPTSLAQRRSEIYWFLSGFFLRGPSREFLANLSHFLAKDRDAAPARDTAAFDAEALNVEFTRLFQGLRESDGPPPYESLYRENRMLGRVTISVMDAYQEAGFRVIDGHAGPQDHIGVELRFMALLCYREMQAREAGDEGETAAWLECQRRFLDEHALQWMPACCDSVRLRTRQDYFRGAMDITKAFLLDDRKQIADLATAAPAHN